MDWDPVEEAAAAIIARWRSHGDVAEGFLIDRDILREALKIVGEYDPDILAGVALAALETQVRRAPVVPFRRRGGAS